jgi:hypothetical protein
MVTSQSQSSTGGGDAAPGADPGSSLSERAGAQGIRAAVFVSGVGLLVGFFMPWMRFGEVVALSGLSLLFSSGTAVTALAGPSRGLLIIIPVCGAVLVATSVFAPRFAAPASLVSGIMILLFGLFTLIRLFFETMGIGMWVVVLSSFVAAGVGIAAVARSRSLG